MRDEVVRIMREADIEVSTDWEAGQRVLDSYKELVDMAKKNQQLKSRKLSSSEEEQAYTTDISDADAGAKVIQKIDKLAKKLENLPNNPVKTFIGNLAKELNAQKHGSNSEYASFVTENVLN